MICWLLLPGTGETMLRGLLHIRTGPGAAEDGLQLSCDAFGTAALPLPPSADTNPRGCRPPEPGSARLEAVVPRGRPDRPPSSPRAGDAACRWKRRKAQVGVGGGKLPAYLCLDSNRNASSEQAWFGRVHGLYLCFPSWNLHFLLSCLNFSALRTGRRQLPVPSHGWRLHFAVEQSNKEMHLVFFKSIEDSDNFGLLSKSLLPPHGSSPALQVAPSLFLRLSDAGWSSGWCR